MSGKKKTGGVKKTSGRAPQKTAVAPDGPGGGKHDEKTGNPPARPNKKRAAKHSPQKNKGSDRSRYPILRFLTYWGLVLAVWGVIAVVGIVFWYAHDLPEVDKLKSRVHRPSVTLTTFDGRQFAHFGDIYGQQVTLKKLPKSLPNAILATEDRRFYDHFGLDFRGLARAMYVNIKTGRIVQGGSTITQQLAKNLFLTSERTVKRKVQEVLLALWLENRFSKDEILEIYMNRVYLGAGAYGVEAAAQRYFSKPAARLSLAEAAMIAGLLKAPSRYAPTRSLKTARARAAVVLDNMVAAGLLQEPQAERAKKNPARLRKSQPAGRQTGYFADWVFSRLSDFIGYTERDLVVVTTLDSRLQKAAERAISHALTKRGKKAGVQQAALIAMTPGGAVRAMVGGASYRKSQFNRATQARRQPGSVFKPIVYLAGLEAGLNPDSRVIDRPITIGKWSPKNFSNKYAGAVSLRTSLARSLNSVAVRVSEKAGRQAVREAAFRLGITTNVPAHPSIALGTADVSLLEMTGAYGAFANNGIGALPHGILEIRDRRGNVLFRRSGSGAGQVISPLHAAQMTSMLTETIQKGTGRAARLKRPAAGKTGTSQNHRDAWFIGYTADYLAGVWFGNDNGSPSNRLTGGALPARTWRHFMTIAHKGLPAHRFNQVPREFKGFLDRLLGSLLQGGGENAANEKDDYSDNTRNVTP